MIWCFVFFFCEISWNCSEISTRLIGFRSELHFNNNFTAFIDNHTQKNIKCVNMQKSPLKSLKKLTQNDYEQHDADNSHDDHHFHVGPPLFTLQLSSLLLELRRAMLQCVSAMIELRKLLVTLQHFFDIHSHDSDYLVHFLLCLLETFVLRLAARAIWRGR